MIHGTLTGAEIGSVREEDVEHNVGHRDSGEMKVYSCLKLCRLEYSVGTQIPPPVFRAPRSSLEEAKGPVLRDYQGFKKPRGYG